MQRLRFPLAVALTSLALVVAVIAASGLLVHWLNTMTVMLSATPTAPAKPCGVEIDDPSADSVGA
ncbi:MAG: hypothetical protein LC797_13310 [Chloroflexi bacterium]|nr:hypothetical protein [Chloroflexota bacterium]